MLAKSSANAFTPIQLKSVIPLERRKRPPRRPPPVDASVEEITSLSADTLEREHSDKIRRLSERRKGMSLEDALAIADGTITPDD